LQLLVFVTILLAAQVPQKISYQALIRDANGNPLIEKVCKMQISILEGSTNSSSSVYTEFHDLTTNKYGMVSLEIGGGTVYSGIGFENINWGANTYFCETQVNLLDGNGYQLAGVSELISVPYALFSAKSGSVEHIDYAAISNTPTLFSGNYEDLNNQPNLFSGNWNDLENIPNLYITQSGQQQILNFGMDRSVVLPSAGNSTYEFGEQVNIGATPKTIVWAIVKANKLVKIEGFKKSSGSQLYIAFYNNNHTPLGVDIISKSTTNGWDGRWETILLYPDVEYFSGYYMPTVDMAIYIEAFESGVVNGTGKAIVTISQ